MTGISKGREIAIGVRTHTGWAAYVILCGDPEAPTLVGRGRLDLSDAANEESKMLYHAAESMPYERARKHIERRRISTARLADRALGAILGEGARVKGCCVLTASGKPLPELRSILSSHALIHAAEGEFYRAAVAEACARRKIAVQRVRERDVAEETMVLPVSAARRRDRLIALGKQAGPPWTQDQKLSALGAWLVLAARSSPR